MAFNYGHDYKMSQIFEECEQINSVERREHKALRDSFAEFHSFLHLTTA